MSWQHSTSMRDLSYYSCVDMPCRRDEQKTQQRIDSNQLIDQLLRSTIASTESNHLLYTQQKF